MSEETKVEATTEDVKAEAAAEGTSVTIPKKKKKKWPIIVGVVAVVVVAAGAGFWVWHEQPSFCNAICHTPMDEYVMNYDQEPNTQGTDKWGNKVSNTNAMLAVSHKVEGEDCLSCHIPTLGEQITEGMHWVTGDYIYPLEERSGKDLREAHDGEGDSFCLNESCHNFTRDDLLKVTADMDRNPHQPHHSKVECTDCHKAHRASVNTCSGCHTDADIPEGWLEAEDAKKLTA